MRILLTFIYAAYLFLGACSGCSGNSPKKSDSPQITPGASAPGEGTEGEGPNYDEGGDAGPTDEIETPEESNLVPANEPER